MDISEIRKRKKEARLTNAEIAQLSGVPISTVNKIFCGATDNPKYRTYRAIETVLLEQTGALPKCPEEEMKKCI